MFCIKLKVSKALVSNESSKTNCGTNFGREKNLWSKPQYNKFSWVFTNFFGYFNFYEFCKSHFVGIYFRESPGLQIIASITFRKYLKNVKYFCKILLGLGLKDQ